MRTTLHRHIFSSMILATTMMAQAAPPLAVSIDVINHATCGQAQGSMMAAAT
ncbi:MAG: hypothetical protein JNM91_12085, partial [Flavobacteriales bacterium]|nr:hypothetical protein [Flavobacteriales bacterium]